jgi:hypothetical protein
MHRESPQPSLPSGATFGEISLSRGLWQALDLLLNCCMTSILTSAI